ncbi:hypothetical protein CGLO_02546 [Colletotrichum gloeosporioides Cg-14]|uniref:F-box domain-containing protein n=1 Tax=Colletotrichum gloeosporioides (strain Cg-14) TaxID=1237896 RepID=T0M8K3_COLGC|nr:hypothetical protein CGLO_02546 [Colletotrichum gloeosporioides Cg-14]
MDTTRLTEATFASLPSELLSMIGNFLDNTHDLSNLARINHTFYRVFNRLLYKAAVKDHHPGPTIEAASNGNLGTLKLAAEHGANLDYHHVKPLTADEIAAKSVDIEAPARLYCGCENPHNILDYHRCFRDRYDNSVMVWTPLHYAICHRQTEIAHILLSAGSSPLCTVPPRPESWPPGLEILEELYSDRPTRIRHRYWDYDKFPINIAFCMHHASAASKLVECGTPIWSREDVWDYDIDSFEKVEKPIALLTEVLAGWDYKSPRTNTRFCGLTDKCCDHDEHEIAAKKKAFLKLAQRTVEEVPHEVSTDELKDVLTRGLIAMFDHADFCDEDFSEYANIIKPALEEGAIGEFGQSTLSLLVNHKTRDYEFAQMHGITFLLDDQWFGEPITHIDNRLMKRTLDRAVRKVPWLDDDGYAILTNTDCLIRTMELLRVHGAWKDAREQPGRISTEEKSSWSLAGTIVKGEKCSELSGQWNKLRPDELKIIPSKFRHIFTKVRWES